MSKITLANGRYVDESGNSWSASCESEESAKTKSDSLSDCRYCSDCSGCGDNPQRYTTDDLPFWP